ncbi:tetratricopeptide repeat protein [Paraliobacillus salinarum]|uniref:tetratricopeptide repeat protein n=1 Tax=Paraliobacillus salinarum TaxID=1158996 RepID=UPI0015F7806D|nr:tetratricopeptide repeat protein [Paraliobacillus salinarum]
MQCTLTINKKSKQVDVLKMYMYKQSKVIETIDKNNRYFYLVFYHNQYINGAKATKIKLGSHIHRALTHGITTESNHPFVKEVLNRDTYPCIKFNQLYTKLQQHYPPKETALILSFFDSFTSPDAIQKLLKKTFYSYRRNGKLRKAFQVLNILNQMDPADTFALDMIGKMEFQNERTIYQSLDSLEQRDPIHFESVCFNQLENPEILTKLIGFYDNNNRALDAAILRTFILKKQFNQSAWDGLLAYLAKHDTETQIYSFLELNQTSPHPTIKKELVSKLLGSSYHNEAVAFFIEHEYIPTTNETTQLIDHLNKVDSQKLIHYFHQSKKKIKQLHHLIPKKQIEQIIVPFVKAFLSTYSLGEVQEWIVKTKIEDEQYLIEKNLNNIALLENDPDQQYKLGELYLSLGQLDKAIECFKWEIELDPNNLKSMKAVIDLLKQSGDFSEAKNYEDLLIQTQKYG